MPQSSTPITWLSEGKGILGYLTKWYQKYLHRAQCNFQDGLEEGKGDGHGSRGG